VDSGLAPAVQRGLHRLAKRWTQLRALRVFRDQSSLSASPDLWATIEDALRRSRYFILLASPEAAGSEWVRREIGFWQDHRERDTFLIVLTDGEICWDAGRGDFDWRRTDALPSRLSGWFDAEPLWVDLSWARTESHLSTRHPRFRNAVGTLAAAVHGIPKDEFDSEDVRQHRVATRVRRVTAAVLVLLLLVSLAATVTAADQRSTARRQRDIAEQERDAAGRQRRLATGRALVAEAENLRRTQPRTSVGLSLAALRVDPSPQAYGGLVATLMQTRYAGGSAGPGDLDVVALSRDGRMLATTPLRRQDHIATLSEVAPSGRRNQLAVLTGHTGSVRTVAFGPGDRMLATAGDDRTVILWDLAERTRPRRAAALTGLGGVERVDTVAFSPDGTTLAAVGQGPDAGGALFLWDVGDLAHPRRLAARTGVYDSGAAVFSPDGRTLVTSTGRIIGEETPTQLKITHGSGATVWDIADRTRPTASARIRPGSRTTAVSPDGRLLAVAHGSTVALWDLADRARLRRVATLSGHTDAVSAMAFSPDGHTLMTAGLDNAAILWDVADPAHPRRSATLTGHPTFIGAVAFDRAGTAVTTADDDGTIARWRVTGRAQPAAVAKLAGHASSVQAVAFSPDGRALATAGFDGTVILWDVTDPARPRRSATLVGHTGQVDDVAFSRDGTTLASVGHDGMTLLWDVTDRGHPRRTATLKTSTPVTAVAFSPRTDLMVTVGGQLFKDGWATVWNTADRSRPRRLASVDGLGIVTRTVAFSPDGKILALPGRTWLDLYDMTSPSAPHRLSPEHNMIGNDEAAFNPDGKTLAADGGAAGAAALWDVTTPSRPRRVADLASQSRRLTGIGFHPGGNLLTTAGQDGAAILWVLADPARPVSAATLRAHTDSLTGAAFSPDGRLLATASKDGTAVVWNIGGLPDVAADPTRLACDIAGPGLTPEEWERYLPGLPYQRPCP
jgi:WD40 repeat protein